MAIYNYDAVGNLTSIQRADADTIPGPVAITLVTPTRGKVGTVVSLFGKGFSTTASENTVSFNGGLATVTAATPYRLTTTVPSSAANGLITVTTPLGSASSPTPFKVLGPITVSPTTATLGVGGTQQFTVAAAGGGTTDVTWSVNGVIGGNATLGTLSSSGMYSTPPAVSQATSVTVRATDAIDPEYTASATVNLTTSSSTVFAAAHGVTVSPPGIRPGIYNSIVASLTVQPSASLRPSFAHDVSVWPSDHHTSTVVASSTTAAVAPVITAVSPASGARGAVNLAVTLTGNALTGATALTFFLNTGAAESAVSATNIVVNAEGTQLTAQVSITSTAAIGARAIQVTTPGGSSTSFNTGGNTFTVQ